MSGRRWGLVFVALALLWATPLAHGANSTALPFVGFGDIAVDSTNEYVFVSSGQGGSSVAVFDFEGELVTTISGQQGAMGLAVDEASGTLYVALANVSQISMIDTSTLTETSRAPTTGMSAPGYLVLAGGRLWFSYGCPQGPGGGGSVALDGSDPTSSGFAGACARLAAYPGDPNLLAVTEQGGSSVYVFDVSTGTPEEVTHSFSPGGSGNIQQVAVSPAGDQLYMAAGAPYQIQRFATSGFTLSSVYPTGPYPVSVALSSDGAFVAGGTANGYSPDIYVFDTDSGDEVRRWNFETNDLVSRGLAFSADASRLFAVTINSAATELALRTFGAPTEVPAATGVTLTTSAATVNHGKSVKLTAHLSGTTGGTLSFYEIPSGSTKALISSVPVDGSGNASLTRTPARHTRYIVEYDGDDTHAPSVSPFRLVKVRAITTLVLRRFYRTSGKYKLYHAGGKRPLLVGTVAPSHPSGQMLMFVAQRYSAGSWRTFDKVSFSIESDGSAYGILIASRGTYRLRATFKGDSDHLGDSSPWVYLKVTS